MKPSTGESMWVVGHEDRVQVIHSLRVQEENDVCLLTTFLKELVDTRALPGHQSAPSLSVNYDGPPAELVGEEHLPNTIYVSFGTTCNVNIYTFTEIVLFPRNFESAKRTEAIDKMVMFREYINAHLDGAKLYLHSRMRAKTQEMAQNLKGMSLKKVAPQSKTFRYIYVLCY
jgi:actin related protein 2/3 complex subunit 2